MNGIMVHRRDKTNFYWYQGGGDLEQAILWNFLAADVRDNSKGYIEWTLDPTQDSTAGNAITAIDKEDGYIYLSDLFEPREEGGAFCKYSLEDFIRILQDWQMVYLQKPCEIIMFKENGIIKIVGKD